MESTALTALLLYAFAMSATPGPNNLMLATSGLNFGFRRTLGLMFGIEFGFFVLMLVVAAGLGTLLTAFPAVHLALKLFGGGYLVWMAWQLLRAAEMPEGSVAQPLGFWRGAVFQTINPKAWMMIVGALGAFAEPGDGFWIGVLVIATVFVLTGFVCQSAWAMFGASLRTLLKTRRSYVMFNRVMAGLTALTAVMIFA